MKYKKDHPMHAIWRGMKQRCNNPNRKDYKYYGALGINVCDQWKTFEGFINSFPARPSSLHTIERKDSTKGYCPENCVWATRKEQSYNTSHCKKIDGISLNDWSKRLGLSVACLSVRYAKYGKSCLVENFKPNAIIFNNKQKTLNEWALELKISAVALKKRIERWGLEKALSTQKYETRIGNKNKCGYYHHNS